MTGIPNVSTLAPSSIVDALNKVINATNANIAALAGGLTDASVRAAALSAFNAGGGIVTIPPVTIQLFSPLPLYPGVTYQGTGWQASEIGGQIAAPGAGTVLVGDGTFDCFDFNSVDGDVAPTNYAKFIAGLCLSPGLSGLTIVNFAYGIKVGALYMPGMQYALFERLNIINCTQWGIWAENVMNSRFNDINVINCAVGAVARVASGATADNVGCSTWTNTYSDQGGFYARGIVTWCRNSSSINNEVYIRDQSLRSVQTLLSQAATMDGTTANIAVTDSTNFPVGLPVAFSATANGFFVSTIYFIATSANNVVTVSEYYGFGTAVVSTGTTAVNITSLGMPCIEWAGLDTGCNLTGMKAIGIDAEGSATCRFLMQQYTFGQADVNFMNTSGGTGDIVSWCIRRANNSRTWSTGFTVDGDGLNVSGVGQKTIFMEGQKLLYDAGGGLANFGGMGVSVNHQSGVREQLDTGQISLNGSKSPDISISHDIGNWLDFWYGIILRQGVPSPTGTMNMGQGGSFVLGSSAGGTYSIPTVTANMSGALIPISNPYATPSTITTIGGTQLFNKLAGQTSWAIPPFGFAIFMACEDASSNLYWAVLTTNVPTAVYTIAQLLALTPLTPGQRAFVVDTAGAAAPTFHLQVAGGGATTVASPVYSDGTNWFYD